MISCKLNNAACKLKLNDYKEAKELCTEVICTEKLQHLGNNIVIVRKIIKCAYNRYWHLGPGIWQQKCEGLVQKGTGTHASCWSWFGRGRYQESSRNRSWQQVILCWYCLVDKIMDLSHANHMYYWTWLNENNLPADSVTHDVVSAIYSWWHQTHNHTDVLHNMFLYAETLYCMAIQDVTHYFVSGMWRWGTWG